MKALKFAALAAALIAAAGAGAAFTPVAHGQTTVRPRVAPRAVEILSGRGVQIGVTIRDIDTEDTKAAQAGVMVDDVAEDSPAAKAGVKKGDVLVEYDGERVRSARQFTRLVQETAPGRKVTAAIMREGQKVTVTLEPREDSGFHYVGDLPAARLFEDFGRDFRMVVPRPPTPPAAPAPPAPPAPPALPDLEGFIWRSGNMLGITTTDLSDQLGEYFGTKDGVLVNSVTADSAAAKAGVKAGDVITSFNGAPVGSGSELRRRVQRLEGTEEFTLGVLRDRKSLTLKGKLEQPRNRRTFRSIV